MRRESTPPPAPLPLYPSHGPAVFRLLSTGRRSNNGGKAGRRSCLLWTELTPAFTLTIEQVEQSPLFSPLTTKYPQMCVVCPERVLKHDVMAKVHLDSNVSPPLSNAGVNGRTAAVVGEIADIRPTSEP